MRDELSLLQAQLTYKKRLEAMLTELRSQREGLQKKVLQLEKIMISEHKDVQRLEGHSLAAFVYYALGKKEEKLDAERREYYAARVRYDAAARELEAIEEDISATEEDLQDLANCELLYEQKLEEKRQAIAAAGTADAEKLLHQQKCLNALLDEERELEEAIEAGTSTLHTVHEAVNRLKDAENWGTLDLLGGGLLADMAKHDKLDEAQKSIEQLQIDLQHFNTELADIPIRADMKVTIDAMLQFADIFFDNIFTDAAVLDRIQESYAQIDRTRDQILSVLRQLQTRLEDVHHKIAVNRSVLEQMILNTQL